MKSCPACHTQYTDDTLRYCLQDGTPLLDLAETGAPTVVLGETETFVRPRQDESNFVTQPDVFATSTSPVVTPTARRSNTALIVVATALVMLVILGAIGLAAFLYLRDRAAPGPAVANKPDSVNISSTPVPPRNNAAVNANNAAVNARTPEARPSPVLTSETREAVTAEIQAWISLTESMDLDALMDHYGNRIDYYASRGANKERVRADKVRAFSQFDTINMEISNVSLSPAGDSRVTATFDKAWNFQGDRVSRGKVRQQLVLERVNGRWLIVSERDLKVY